MQYKTCCAPQKVINRCKAGWSKAHLAPSFERAHAHEPAWHASRLNRLNSAKGGDPMSHGSAERSATRIAEHYR
jgi:hypothetical protein